MFDGPQNFRKYPTEAPPIPPATAINPWACHSKPRKDGYWARAMVRDKAKECVIWGGNYFTDLLPPSMRWLCLRGITPL